MSTEDCGLEYSLKFKESSEHDSLFSHGKWSIDEVDKDGKVVNEDLIPWQWGVDFQAKNIIYLAQSEYDSRYVDADDIDARSNYESLSGAIDIVGDKNSWHYPNLEMFGTSRTIEDFSLVIYRSGETKADYEFLAANAGLAFETELDFKTESFQDFLQFTLFLNDKKFDELKKLVIENRLTNISLRVLTCKGFYAHWSPSTHTSLIKLLLPSSSHEIELPE